MKNKTKTLFKVLAGSRMYGLDIPNSDFDYRFVYQQENEQILSNRYTPQINKTKDYVGWEIQRFLELAFSANPNILEILWTPEECILEKDPAFNLLLENKDKFLTKKCRESFGGYAYAQIKKALGLQKKFRWEGEKIEKKEPIDFCYVIVGDKTVKFSDWLENCRLSDYHIGLVNLDHAPHCYSIFFDLDCLFQGVFGPSGDRIITSSVPKDYKSQGTLVYNRDSYKIHCKDWDSYQDWLKNRNEARYVENVETGLNADHKNLMHCRRLLNMAMEIPHCRNLNVFRNDREKLLAIRRGECNLIELLQEAESDLQKLDEIYAKCDLPDTVDFDFMNDLLLQIRKAY